MTAARQLFHPCNTCPSSRKFFSAKKADRRFLPHLIQLQQGHALIAQGRPFSPWIVATLSYYQDKKIRLCPSTKIVRVMENRSHGGTLAAWRPFDPGGSSDWWADFDTGSYGINEWCSCPPQGVNSYWGFPTENAWRIVDTKGANRVPLFLDSVYVDVYPLDTDGPLDFEPPPYEWNNSWGDWGSQAMRLVCIDRHSGGINSVFLDGSVGKILLRALWKLKWHQQFNVNGPWTKAGGVAQEDWPQWMRKFRDY